VCTRCVPVCLRFTLCLKMLLKRHVSPCHPAAADGCADGRACMQNSISGAVAAPRTRKRSSAASLRIVAKAVQLTLVAAPVLVYLYEYLEENPLSEEFLQSLARLGAHLLQCHTLVADDDTLL